MKLSASNIKKSLIFSQKKAITIFQETETPQNRYISRNGPFYISGNFLYFRNYLILCKVFLRTRSEVFQPKA